MPPAKEASRPPDDRKVGALASLFTAVGNRWFIHLRPSQLFDRAWLRQGLEPVLASQRVQTLADHTGIDLRNAPTVLITSHRHGTEDVIGYAVRHANDAMVVERKFRARLNGPVERADLGHQLTGVWGRVGTQVRALASVGRNVALFQYGGDRKRGPARIALLYARGKLKRFPTLLQPPAMGRVVSTFAEAPAVFGMVGPFDENYARAARGLLATTDVLMVSLQPDARGQLLLRVSLTGNFRTNPALAARLLRLSWEDLAKSDLGHLLQLHTPRSAPQVQHTNTTLTLACTLDGSALLRGLADITSASIQSIMAPRPSVTPPATVAEDPTTSDTPSATSSGEPGVDEADASDSAARKPPPRTPR